MKFSIKDLNSQESRIDFLTKNSVELLELVSYVTDDTEEKKSLIGWIMEYMKEDNVYEACDSCGVVDLESLVDRLSDQLSPVELSVEAQEFFEEATRRQMELLY